MRYVIYGAGGIGATIGGRLFASGCDVVLIARGPHLAALQTEGLTLAGPDGTDTLAVPAVGHPSEAGVGGDDVVVLAVKTQDSAAALDVLAPIVDPAVAIVCAQNGVVNETMALRRFANVHGMSVSLPATHLSPGVVECYASGVWGILDLGRYPAGIDDVDRQMTSDLLRAGFAAVAQPDVMAHKYAKLMLLNLGNVLEAACGSAARHSPLLAAAQQEAMDCAAAAGITVHTDHDERWSQMGMARVGGKRRDGGSTWQSLARGSASLEGDYLNGEVVLLGRLHGVPTPVNEGLQRLGWRLATERPAAGSLSIESVEASIGS